MKEDKNESFMETLMRRSWLVVTKIYFIIDNEQNIIQPMVESNPKKLIGFR